MKLTEFLEYVSGLDIGSLHRYHAAQEPGCLEIGIERSGFIAYAVHISGDTVTPCPDHPYVRKYTTSIGKPWFGEIAA